MSILFITMYNTNALFFILPLIFDVFLSTVNRYRTHFDCLFEFLFQMVDNRFLLLQKLPEPITND